MITFSSALHETHSVLTATGLDKTAKTITIIRDVMGKIRLMLEFSPENHPDETSVAQMEQAFRTHLDAYYGDDLWIVPQGTDHHSSLVELVRRERKEIDWNVGKPVPPRYFY